MYNFQVSPINWRNRHADDTCKMTIKCVFPLAVLFFARSAAGESSDDEAKEDASFFRSSASSSFIRKRKVRSEGEKHNRLAGDGEKKGTRRGSSRAINSSYHCRRISVPRLLLHLSERTRFPFYARTWNTGRDDVRRCVEDIVAPVNPGRPPRCFTGKKSRQSSSCFQVQGSRRGSYKSQRYALISARIDVNNIERERFVLCDIKKITK